MNFTTEHYLSSQLLHLGRDHFYCGLSLLKGDGIQEVNYEFNNSVIPVVVFDSGAYLIHLGIELILKAMILEKQGFFNDIHLLKSLIKHFDFLDNEQCLLDTLFEIDEYYYSRYGKNKNNNPVEIGNDNIKNYITLFHTILSNMPLSLQKDYNNLNPFKKAGRVLMQKPISK